MAGIRLGVRMAMHAVLLVGGMMSGAAWAGLAASVTLQAGQPTGIYPGETTVLEIVLANNNATAAINGVAFSNSLPGVLPNGLKVAGAATYTCFDPATNTTTAGTGTLSATVGGQALQLSGGSIPPHGNGADGRCTIRVPVTAGSSTGNGSAYTYTIANGSVTGNDGAPVANVGAVSQSVNVNAIAQPTISKAFSNATAVLGGAARTLTLTVNNPNPIPIGNFSLADSFPALAPGGAIIQVANPANASSTCTGAGIPAAFAPSAGDVAVSASGGTLPANGSCTITVDVEARQTNGLYTTGARNNTINAVSQFSNELGIRAQANATAAITVTSPLSVGKAFAPSSLASGQVGAVTITLTNSGDTPLTVTSFTDSPIDGTGSADITKGLLVTGVGTTCVGGAASIVQASGINRGVQLTGGVIPAGGSCTVTANFTATTQAADTPVTYTNTLPAGAVDVGNAAIVSQNVSATLMVADSLRVTKSISGSAPRPGAPVRYLITVQNWTLAPMSNVSIQDALPTGFTYLTGTINGLNYTPTLAGTGCTGFTASSALGDASADFLIGTVPPRTGVSTPGSCSVAFYAMVPTDAANGASTVNTLPPGAVCTDNGAGVCNNGTVTSGNVPVGIPALTIAKAFNPAGPLPEGTISRMTFTLRNYSIQPLGALSVSDTLPGTGLAQLRVASPANAATTCGGTLTAAPGSTSVALNGGTVPARASGGGVIGAGAAGSCVVQVDVVGPAGVYPNTASASGTETYANGASVVLVPVEGSASITYNSTLAATKTFSPGAVSSGGRSTVTIRLANTGSAALTNIRVTDPLPAGMTLASPTNAYATCDGATAIAGAPGAASIELTGANVAAGGSCDLRFDVVATGAANWVNTIPAGNIISLDNGVTNQTAVTGTLTHIPGNALTVAKVTSPGALAFPGQPSRMTITITNGNTAVTGLRLTDYFTSDGQPASPANGMVIAADPQPSTTCPAGSVTAVAGGTSVALNNATLAAAASCTVSVNVTATKTGGVTNTIPVGAIGTHQALSNAQAATTSLTTQTNVGIVKQFTPAVMKAGERSRLRLSFYNGGSQPATNLSVTDNLPAGLTVPAGPNPVTTCGAATVSAPSSTQVQVSGGSLAASAGGVAASCYAEIDVVAATEGNYVNTVPAGALTATVGGNATTNADPATATLRVKQPVVVHKAIGGFTLDAGNPGGFATGEASRSPGSTAPLVIRLENPNADVLTQAALTDALPTGLVVAPTPAAATTCAGGTVTADPSATSIALSGATLPATGFCTVTVNVLSNIAGTYTNQIAAAALSTFEGVSNEEPSRARIVVTSPPGVGKQFAPPVIPPGGTSRLTIVVDNDNASDMTLTANLVDTLPTAPGAMKVATPNGLTTTCPGGVGVIQAAANSATVRLNSGAVIPPGGCRIEVDVTAAVPGSYNNNLPAGALQTNFGSNPQPVNAELKISTLGYISGKVFLDNLAPLDGVYAAGTDAPLTGVEIQLRGGASCAGPLLFTSHSDAQGNYLFADLAAGTYSVCQPAQPAGTLNGTPRAGAIVPIGASTGTPGTASNPTATSSQITGIVLGNDAGDNARVSGSPGNDFAEVAPVSLAGTVFEDGNNDGIQQGADTGLAGVQLVLSGSDWQGKPVNVTVTTNASGDYSFDKLPPSGPAGYTITQPNQPASTSNGITTAGPAVANGTAGTASNPTATSSRIAGIVLPPGASSTGNNFAELGNDRAVYGRVYRDFDDNGSFNGSDNGIGGQVIQLTGNDANGNPVSRSATTLADGTFAFHGLPESDGAGYTLTQPNQPPGTQSGFTTAGTTGGTATPKPTTPSRIAGLNLSGANKVSADNLFGEFVPGGGPIPGGGGTTGIPTLSEWGLMLLSLMLAGLGLRQVRRRCAA